MERTYTTKIRWVAWTFVLLVCWTGHTEAAAPSYLDLNRQPDSVTMTTDSSSLALIKAAAGTWKSENIQVAIHAGQNGLTVELAAPIAAVKHLTLRWLGNLPLNWKYLGDTWERGYGEMEWLPLAPERMMPWYFLASNGQSTHGYGVKTGANAICHWTCDPNGITLHADVRSGGVGTRLGERKLQVCTVVCRTGHSPETPFATARALCYRLCSKPLLPRRPVYGFNDWYCAYGQNTTSNFLADVAHLVSLAPRGGNRPFAVVDAGWQTNSGDDACGPGPWDRANARFSKGMSMPELARQLKALGARPGLWYRPLIANPEHPKDWRLARDPRLLDPTLPAVQAQVRNTISQFRTWGYELIKFDFTTYDITGHWGFERNPGMSTDGWAFANRTQTTAEIIADLYRNIRQAAGKDVLLIGCNTIGHLAAGYVEIQRIGDDTSGKEWDRTRKMGINSLAFRAPQHGAFFAIDGDCAGQVAFNSVPWDKNQQWLKLLSSSGTPLFISFPRATVTPEQKIALRAALLAASKSQPLAEPIDWMEQRTPVQWRLQGKLTTFSW